MITRADYDESVEQIAPIGPSHPEDLMAAIRSQTARIAVIGLGYVGLPLSEAFATAGFSVFGFDVDRQKVEKLRRGESYMKHIPDSRVAELVRSGRFEATTDPAALGAADVVVICVPTPLTVTRDPDLSYVTSAGRLIREYLRRGQLVVLESSTYPGTTNEVLRPILEESGLEAGRDFFLAYSPEREDPGNTQYSTQTIPRVVGGMNAVSTELAAAVYEGTGIKVIRVSSPQVAEACKILENTYRAVNIALVNELKVVFESMGIDIWEVIEAAKTKPFGFQAFYPGPGLGGHCIPIDPFYLTWVARKYGINTRFIELAGEVNTAMPQYVLKRVADALNDRERPIKGSRICVLGAAYKKDVDDCRESPAVAIIEMLLNRGAEVTFNDPHVPVLPCSDHCPVRLESRVLTEEFLADQDCVLIITPHSAYDFGWIADHARLIVDTRNATGQLHAPRAVIVKS